MTLGAGVALSHDARMRFLLCSLLVSLSLAIAGCGGSTPSCEGILCGACPEPLQLTVTLAAGVGGPVTSDSASVACTPSDPGMFVCHGQFGVGEHTVTLSAAGHEPEAVTFTITAAPPGCCACLGGFTGSVTLEASGGGDAGMPDASVLDASMPGDAGTDASAAMTCEASRVRFPMGGTLSEGTLCDDVFVCVASEADAARVMAAGDHFECMETSEGPCSGRTCAYRNPGGPSTLDAQEIAEICAVTVIAPPPSDIACIVYL